ncbi:hypothetical protein ACFQHV_21285 [Promicromonospora thailandica]|uniref:Glycosyltransferase family 28 N-terminal domain n=1 Tax=Promicromonospora thailandica TaxID=765201 RepID=A0A9X2G648_9MICO|nr:hypothetical protein [Promicromonospora thailandica]MCP2263261.1 Glycosyltransferase family 28 N-terminal domain [Promicromonospora thailandica]BFF18651.1 hypothetical protein GCM10025730_21720 [Promicromonospora thailandica]
MTRIIVAATSIYGHVAPMLAVAEDLVARGHDVTFVTGSRYRDAVEVTGASFAPVAGAADLDMAVEAVRPERLELPPGVEQFAYDMRVLFADAIPEQFKVLKRLIAEADEPVVLVHEVWFWGGLPFALAAENTPAPVAVVAVGITQLTVSSADLAPYGAGLPPDRSESGRLRNKQLHEQQLAGPLGATQRDCRTLWVIVSSPATRTQQIQPRQVHPRPSTSIEAALASCLLVGVSPEKPRQIPPTPDLYVVGHLGHDVFQRSQVQILPPLQIEGPLTWSQTGEGPFALLLSHSGVRTK